MRTNPGYFQAIRSRRPIELAWSQEFATLQEAFAVERQLKGWGRAKKQALVAGDWDGVQVLARKLCERSFDTLAAPATQDERGLNNG